MSPINRFSTYCKIWWLWASYEFQQAFIHRFSALIFILGKLVRLGMTLLLLLIIKSQVKYFAGYTTDQLVVFFLTFQLIDVISQVMYRGVYVFGQKIRTGEFDFSLLKPISPLFQALTSKVDVNDVIFLGPVLLVSFYLFKSLEIDPTWINLVGYLILMVNGLLIATAVHILILAAGIFMTDIDSLIWLYRDLGRLGQFPIKIYPEMLGFILTFLIPIGLMITVPAEVLIGVSPSQSLLVTMVIGGGSLIFSWQLWRLALKKYSGVN